MMCPYFDAEISRELCAEKRKENAGLLGSPCATCPYGAEDAVKCVHLAAVLCKPKCFPYVLPPESAPKRRAAWKAKAPRRGPRKAVAKSAEASSPKPKKRKKPGPKPGKAKRRHVRKISEAERLARAIGGLPVSCQQRGNVGLNFLAESFNSLSLPEDHLERSGMRRMLRKIGLHVDESGMGAGYPVLVLDRKVRDFVYLFDSKKCM
ncbi:hypothetical protein LWC08_03070 [Desulfobaculum bizertense]|uniref:hypothetical protein n=1 Tax=Desulfobaculum bizertense TaxID=376490 RepID=UPI001F24096A|nr:hypothetical protein [Desulfobaculum bizertense]UIJ38565.1 hypothetical protein LWC08_03070 [Desulfobaculum bizertense]